MPCVRPSIAPPPNRLSKLIALVYQQFFSQQTLRSNQQTWRFVFKPRSDVTHDRPSPGALAATAADSNQRTAPNPPTSRFQLQQTSGLFDRFAPLANPFEPLSLGQLDDPPFPRPQEMPSQILPNELYPTPSHHPFPSYKHVAL